MTDEQKREHADAIKHALGMGYGPPMEGEEGWVPTPKAWIDGRRLPIFTAHDPASTPCARIIDRKTLPGGGICLTVVAEPHEVMDAIGATADRLMAEKRAANAQSVIDQIRQDKERRMADELAKERAKAAEPKPAPPSDDPWAVIGKAEDDGEWIMDITRNRMSDTPTDERGAPLASMIRQLQERLAEAEAKISSLREDDEWMMRQLGKHSRKVNDLASALMEAADAIETDCGGRPDLRESTAQMYRAMANTTSEYMGWLRYGEDDE